MIKEKEFVVTFINDLGEEDLEFVKALSKKEAKENIIKQFQLNKKDILLVEKFY